MNGKKCEVIGCKNLATWEAHKLWGKGGSILVCNECKPGASDRPARVKPLRAYYKLDPIKPINPTMTFEEFRATGEDIDDIGESATPAPGRIYLGVLVISGPDKDGLWTTAIQNSSYSYANLEEVERPLYDFAVEEGYDLKTYDFKHR
jgi:hypothetical protein